MRRTQPAPFLLALVLSVPAFSGCGSDKKVDDIKVSPEATAADSAGQKGMQEFMKTKGAPRPR